jgi:hypothetical protein
VSNKKYKNINNYHFFRQSYFYLGWALREHQEFGKRGGGKHMTERVKQLLKTYFLSGDVDRKNRFTASAMLEELQKKVGTGELEVNEIPKIKTIENWISRYNQEHKKEAAAKKLYTVPTESK